MSEETTRYEYEVAVVGGGPAGMSAALYSTRLGHKTAVVNRGGGRAAMMQEVHNLLGVTEETTGSEFEATEDGDHADPVRPEDRVTNDGEAS